MDLRNFIASRSSSLVLPAMPTRYSSPSSPTSKPRIASLVALRRRVRRLPFLRVVAWQDERNHELAFVVDLGRDLREDHLVPLLGRREGALERLRDWADPARPPGLDVARIRRSSPCPSRARRKRANAAGLGRAIRSTGAARSP